ncbi:MAG TPA: hypothetical protein VNK95_20000 [Caldilineaceae bacterium]|nr:hypothetical protein [Caldilineaceae bacterium]
MPSTPPAEPAQGPPRRLLLTSADWQTRALTLVSLKELGYEVLALPGLRYGLRAILQDRVDPPLLLVDTKDDDAATPEQIARLHELLPDAPLVVLTEAWYRASYEPLRPNLAALLVRPVMVQEIVETVQRLLPPSATSA